MHIVSFNAVIVLDGGGEMRMHCDCTFAHEGSFTLGN